MKQIYDPRQADVLIDDAILEACGSLSRSIGESVPVHDYRDSVELLFSALAPSLRSTLLDRFQA